MLQYINSVSQCTVHYITCTQKINMFHFSYFADTSFIFVNSIKMENYRAVSLMFLNHKILVFMIFFKIWDHSILISFRILNSHYYDWISKFCKDKNLLSNCNCLKCLKCLQRQTEMENQQNNNKWVHSLIKRYLLFLFWIHINHSWYS